MFAGMLNRTTTNNKVGNCHVSLTLPFPYDSARTVLMTRLWPKRKSPIGNGGYGAGTSTVFPCTLSPTTRGGTSTAWGSIPDFAVCRWRESGTDEDDRRRDRNCEGARDHPR